jgi:hypothetical protein
MASENAFDTLRGTADILKKLKNEHDQKWRDI